MVCIMLCKIRLAYKFHKTSNSIVLVLGCCSKWFWGLDFMSWASEVGERGRIYVPLWFPDCGIIRIWIIRRIIWIISRLRHKLLLKNWRLLKTHLQCNWKHHLEHEIGGKSIKAPTFSLPYTPISLALTPCTKPRVYLFFFSPLFTTFQIVG